MEAIEQFLKIENGNDYGSGSGNSNGSGNGDGYGYGNGNGDASGDGSGAGYGSGYGYGYGIGSGSGFGYGYGYGIGSGSGNSNGSGNGVGSINGMPIFRIDGVPTVITNVKGNIAKGWILKNNLTLNPCYIAKQDNMFAHGKTLREAMEALEEKLFDDMPEEERIEAFLDAVKDGQKYPARLFFDWHGRLTGSCQMGRETFVKNHGIVLDKDTMTLRRFLNLTREGYGGEIIRRIEDIIK